LPPSHAQHQKVAPISDHLQPIGLHNSGSTTEYQHERHHPFINRVSCCSTHLWRE
jgi:hypothetical protein